MISDDAKSSLVRRSQTARYMTMSSLLTNSRGPYFYDPIGNKGFLLLILLAHQNYPIKGSSYCKENFFKMCRAYCARSRASISWGCGRDYCFIRAARALNRKNFEDTILLDSSVLTCATPHVNWGLQSTSTLYEKVFWYFDVLHTRELRVPSTSWNLWRLLKHRIAKGHPVVTMPER